MLQAARSDFNLKRKLLYLSVLLALLMALVPSANAQTWEVVSFPSTEQLTGICLIGPDTVYIIGGSGKIYRSFDQGEFWESFLVDQTVQLEDLCFFNSDTGYVCGRKGGIFMTTDAGYNWSNKSIADTTPWFFDIEMFDRKNGIAIGASRIEENPMAGIGLKTVDGGQSWQNMDPMGMGYSEAGSMDDGTAYFVSFGLLHTSKDKGRSWISTPTGNGSPARTITAKGNTIILAGPNGMILRSSDKGKTWAESKQDYETVFICVRLVNESVAYIGGVNTPILRTDNGGKSWAPEPNTGHFQIFDMAVSPDYVWVVGTKGLVARKKID